MAPTAQPAATADLESSAYKPSGATRNATIALKQSKAKRAQTNATR